MAAINPILQLTPDTYSQDGYVNAQELTRALQNEAAFNSGLNFCPTASAASRNGSKNGSPAFMLFKTS